MQPLEILDGLSVPVRWPPVITQAPHLIFYRYIYINMIVRPIQAALIRDTEMFARMDPYCKIYLGGQCQRTAVCQNGGKTPRWGETFTFANNGDQNIRVEVWDFDTVGNDDLIGAGSLNIPNVVGQGGGNSIWVDLFFNGRVAGRVCLSITMNNMGMGMGMNNMGMGMNNMGMGMNNPMGGMNNPMGGMNNPMGMGGYNQMNNNPMGYPQYPPSNNGWGY